jgi:hypothetical protein
MDVDSWLWLQLPTDCIFSSLVLAHSPLFLAEVFMDSPSCGLPRVLIVAERRSAKQDGVNIELSASLAMPPVALTYTKDGVYSHQAECLSTNNKPSIGAIFFIWPGK